MPTLVIEDDRANREALVRLLKVTGRVVYSAQTVADAMEQLKHSPRACLLDVRLPDGSGLAVLARIRSMHLRTKVALLTGSIDEQSQPEVAESRPDAVFIKPVPAATVLDWVDRAAPVQPAA
jgi:CheY-like chemotaxis protein